jgi:cold shock CspA family protein
MHEPSAIYRLHRRPGRGGGIVIASQCRRRTGRQRGNNQMKAQPAPRATETVKWFDPERGYGFVVTADYREIFAHRSQVADGRDLPKGKAVSFVEDVGRDGKPFARRIEIAKD